MARAGLVPHIAVSIDVFWLREMNNSAAGSNTDYIQIQVGCYRGYKVINNLLTWQDCFPIFS